MPDGSITPRAVHFALANGRHNVVLCDPSRLAQPPVRTTFEWKYVTCHRCIAAHEADEFAMKQDIQRRMADPGAPRPNDD